MRTKLAVTAALVAASMQPVLAAASPAAATAGTPGPCAGDRGVTVVVDFQGLGGGVHVGCAPGAVGSGFDALTAAGFGYDVAVRSAGFLCRISGRPADDPCIDTSPSEAYWSYWVADRDGPWCYSDVGAGSRTPHEGTVEGWSFSSGGGVGNAPPPRSGTFVRLPGDQRLPRNACIRPAAAPVPGSPSAGPAPTNPPAAATPRPAAPSGPAPAPAVAAAPTPGRPTPAGPPEAAVSEDQPTNATGPSATTSPSTAPGSAGDDARRDGTGDSPEPGATATADEATGEAEAEAESAGVDGDGTDDGGVDGDEEALSAEDLARSVRDGSGSPWGAALATGMVLALAAGAVVVNRRRFGTAGAAPGET